MTLAEQRRDFERETGWQADAYPDRFREWVKKQEVPNGL